MGSENISEEIKALRADVAKLKKDAQDDHDSLDGIIDQINRALSNLKARLEKVEQAVAKNSA